MKRMFLFLCVLLMCRTPTFAALTYDQANYVANKAYLGAGNYNDPLYNFWGEVEAYLEGDTSFTTINLGGVEYTMPGADGTTGQVLVTDGSATLSWSTNGGTFTGGNITSDITMSNGEYIRSTTTTAQVTGIQVYDTDGTWEDAIKVTNGSTAAVALGDVAATLAIASSGGLNVSTAGVVTGVAGLAATGDLTLDDSGDLEFGTHYDFVIDSDTTATLDVTPLAEDETAIINFGADTIGINLKGFAATGSDYLLWNAANEALEGVGVQVHLDDDSDLQFGTDKDFVVDSDTTKVLDILPAAASDDYLINIGLDQSGVDVKMFGATTGEYWSWDAGADSVLANLGNVAYTTTDAEANQFKVDATGAIDGDAIVFETTNGGILLDADGSSYGDIELNANDDVALTAVGDITATAGNFYFGANGEDVPMVWYAETSGAEMTATGDGWTFDGMDITFGEGDYVLFGDGGDLSLSSTSNVLTLGQVQSGTGSFVLGANGKGIDTTFYSETEDYTMMWDQDGNSNVGALTFNNSSLIFNQTNADYTFNATGDAMSITATDHSSSALTLGASGGTNGMDVILQTHTAGAEVTFNAGADTLTVDGVTTIINEGDKLEFGDGGDLALSCTSNILTLSQVVESTGSVAIGVENKGIDVNFPAETTDDHMLWDQDGNTNTGALVFRDSAIIHDQADVDYTWVAASDILNLTATDHSSAGLVFGVSGGTTNAIDVTWYAHTDTAAVTLDGGADMVTFEGVDITMNDSDSINFGDSAAESTLLSDGSGTDWTLTNGTLTIGDGGSANYASFAQGTGALTFAGTARPTKGKYLPAQVFTAIAGTPVLTTEIGTDKGLGFAMDDTGEEGIVTTFTVPDDWAAATDVTVNVYWATSDATGTGVAAVWDVNTIPLASDEDISGATIIVDTATDNLVSGTAWDLNVSQNITITASTEWAAGDLISFMLFRDGDNAADDVTGDAVVLGVKITYTSDEP